MKARPRKKSGAAKTKEFGAVVSRWTLETEERLLYVHQESARMVAKQMMLPKGQGGFLPYDEGDLQNSLTASNSSMPAVAFKQRKFHENEGQIEGVIAAAKMGGTIYLGFRADYAQKLEYASGNGFVRRTAQRWKSIVDSAVAVVKQRSSG